MDDRVGELLAARAALERGTGAAVVLSVLLHGGLTALAVYAAWHAAPLRTANVVNITMIKMPSASMPAPAAARATKPAPPSPPVVKPQPKTPPAVAAPLPPATKPIDKNSAPAGLFGKSTKKPAAAAPPPAAPADATPASAHAAAAVPGVTDTAAIPVGGTGVSGLEGDFRDALYVQNMVHLIGNHWQRAEAAAGAATTIYFVIERSGTIRDVKVELSSGNGTFDRAAQRAVLETMQLPPLPYTYSGTSVGVHLIFK